MNVSGREADVQFENFPVNPSGFSPTALVISSDFQVILIHSKAINTQSITVGRAGMGG